MMRLTPAISDLVCILRVLADDVAVGREMLPHEIGLVACRLSFSRPARRDRPPATKLDRAPHCGECSAEAISSGIHRGSARSLRCPHNDDWSNLMKLTSFSTQILAVPED